MKKQDTKKIWFAIAALVLFAIGFIGVSLFQAQQLDDRRDQPVPSQPAVPN